MEGSGNRLGVRLIMFPAPTSSHQNPMIQLAYILHSKGFSITFIHTKYNSPNPLAHPTFKFHFIDDGSSEEEAVVKGDFNGFFLLMLKLNQTCVEPFKEALAKLLAEKEKREEEELVACLITSYIWPFTRAIADANKLPRFIFRGDCGLTLSDMDRPPMGGKEMAAILTDNGEAFQKFVSSIEKEAVAASGMIWNSFKELELATVTTTDLLPSHLNFLIGPFINYNIPPISSSYSSSSTTDNKSVISWLDSHPPKSVVYVCFGTLAALDEAEFVEIAWGLANSKRPFLWVVRPCSVRGSEWLEKLPEGFMEAVDKTGHHMIVKWAPQAEVLAHPAIGCFWTHGGWNSILESMCRGAVPMICSPHFGEHFVTSKLVSDYWKVGTQLENGFERGEIEKAIRSVLVEKEGEEMRERMMGFKEKAESSVKQGGSSFKSLEMLVDNIVSFK